MNTAQKQQTKEASAQESLKLPEIEKGLSRLWTEEVPGRREANITRVCTMSMIIPLPDKSLLDTAMEAVRFTSQQNPLRSIYLIAEPVEEPDIKGQVSGYCQVTLEGGLEVCCEEIVLTATGDAASELPSAASELLVEDLPVVVWWIADPDFGNQVTEELVKAADYLIVDSRTFTDTVSEFNRLAENLQQYRQLSAGDLNWSRLDAWREQTADVFDDQTVRSFINQIESLSIDYAGSDGSHPGQAVLFAGWFSSRLGWSCTCSSGDTGGGKFSSHIKGSAGNDVTLDINPVQSSQIDAGNLVTVRCSGAGGKFLLSLTRSEGEPQIQVDVQAEGMDPVQKKSTFSNLTIGELMANEIRHFALGSLYVDALKAGLSCIKHPVESK